MQATLQSARIARYQGDEAAIARLLPDLAPLMASEDVKEGMAAFMQRRPAQFVGAVIWAGLQAASALFAVWPAGQ